MESRFQEPDPQAASTDVLISFSHEAMARWRADGAHVYWWTTPRMRDQRFLTVGVFWPSRSSVGKNSPITLSLGEGCEYVTDCRETAPRFI